MKATGITIGIVTLVTATVLGVISMLYHAGFDPLNWKKEHGVIQEKVIGIVQWKGPNRWEAVVWDKEKDGWSRTECDTREKAEFWVESQDGDYLIPCRDGIFRHSKFIH